MAQGAHRTKIFNQKNLGHFPRSPIYEQSNNLRTAYHEPLWYAHSTALPQSYPTSLLHLSDVLNLVQGSKTRLGGSVFVLPTDYMTKTHPGWVLVLWSQKFTIFPHNLFPRVDFLERLFRNRSYYGVPVRICSRFEALEPLN